MVDTEHSDSSTHSQTHHHNPQISQMTNYQASVNSSMLITGHRLNGTNYLEWSQSVKLAIDGRGKLGYITGEVEEKKNGEDGYNVWRSENSLVTAWLLSSMDASIAKPHMF
ncbi:unnamed protein product, partial [Cuscuta europaea]